MTDNKYNKPVNYSSILKGNKHSGQKNAEQLKGLWGAQMGWQIKC